MRTSLYRNRALQIACLIAAGWTLSAIQAKGIPPLESKKAGPPPAVTVTEDSGGGEGEPVRREEKRIIVRKSKDGEKPGTETPWLGLATEEASGALTSQLKLEPGVGLVVNYLAEDGPAAKAGLKRDDLLTRLGDQKLVHPAQLRKLVQVRKVGDTVTLEYLRAGEKNSVDVTLGKATGLALLNDEGSWSGNLHDVLMDLREGPLRDTIRNQVTILRDQLGNLKIDRDRVQQEVKASLEQARRAVEEALKQAGESKKSEANHARLLMELDLAKARASGSSVTVSSNDREHIRTLIKSDDYGTIHIESTPELNLTAHDKAGKLLFKGPIDTDEQRGKVPRDLWQRVEPLLDQVKLNVEEKN